MGHSDPWQIFKGRIVVLANTDDPATLARIKEAEPREILVLSRRDKCKLGRRSDGTYRAEYRSSSSTGRNNAQIAVLSGRASLNLRKRRYFRGFRNIAIGSAAGWLCAIPGLLRYAIKGELKFVGVLRAARSRPFALPFLVFENRRFGEIGDQRLYGPADMAPRELLSLLEGIDYVLLRWPADVIRGNPMSDIDLLVSDAHLHRTRDVFSQRLGLFPIDVYSESGSGGHAFKAAPYYPPHAARWLLANATTGPSGLRYLAGEPAYLAFAYHLLFHKTEAVAPGTQDIESAGWPGRHLEELSDLARAAGRRRPQTFADLEGDLIAAGMMPPLDTIGFYCARNKFLVDRYGDRKAAPGLSVFLIREFGGEPDPLPEIRQLVLEKGFDIVNEGAISTDAHRHAIETIRGGNWYDRHAPGCLAPPKHFFVCVNRHPVQPSRRTLRRYPRLDDECLLLKTRIRDKFSQLRGKSTNIVHVSDNSAEAQEYIRALGVQRAVAEHIGSGNLKGASGGASALAIGK